MSGVSYDGCSRFGVAVATAASPGRGSAAHLSLGGRCSPKSSTEHRLPSICRVVARRGLGLWTNEGRDGEAALDLGDVDAELALLAGERLFELGQFTFAPVELVLAHLQLDVDTDLAGLELPLTSPDVLDPLLDERLVIGQALLAVLEP